MKEYGERGGKVTGIVLTLVLHACVLAFMSSYGMKYIYPPPPESTFLIDYEEAELQEAEQYDEPKAENLDAETLSPKPEAEPKPDPRAVFPGLTTRDSSLADIPDAANASDDAPAGESERPSAKVKGRNTVGTIPRPAYNVQESGTVVVNIWVDNYGNVVKALPGGDGTTVTNKTLWAAARNAAMETHFNMSADAPAMQEGTITYIFNLK